MRATSTKRRRGGRADLYTLLLIIAFVALVVGCVFLYLEVADYGSPPYPEGGVVTQVTSPASERSASGLPSAPIARFAARCRA